MSASTVIVSGYLTADPVLAHTPSGKAVCNFDLYATRGINPEELEDLPTIRCAVFGPLAEAFIESAEELTPLIIQGHLKRDRRGQLAVNVDEIGISLVDGPQ